MDGFSLRPKRGKSQDDRDDLEHKVKSLFDGHEPLFERLHSEPKTTVALKKLKSAGHKSAHFIAKQPMGIKVVALVGVALLSGGMYAYSAFRDNANRRDISQVAGANTNVDDPSSSKVTSNPSFEVVAPSDKSLEELAGIESSAPSGQVIYTYTDYIDETRIVVTQQMLPDGFSSDPEKLANLAKSYNMNEQFQVDDTLVYHGLNEKTSIQWVGFIKGSNLVLVQSDSKIAEEQWVGYVSNLQLSNSN